MKRAGNSSIIQRSYEERATVADIEICFSYTHTDAPFDGGNSFTRALREYVSRVPDFAIVDDLHSEYDILFMNQLSRSPGIHYALSEIRAALDGGSEKKVVVRAINLECNRPHGDSIHHMKDCEPDRPILDLLNMADFVIFQSHFQKSFFDRFGYKGKNHSIIHNGAAPAFLNVPGGVKRLEAGDDLVLVSSGMTSSRLKNQETIAALSLIPGVRVIHSGIWPEGLDQGKVELAGVLSHDELARIYEGGYYFLHPAIHDVCPNCFIEGLAAGLPAIYNSGYGSGFELGGKFGISLIENDLPGTVALARQMYEPLATALATERHYYSIARAAKNYLSVFRTLVQR
jgi:glycosyltransferase involved in cell wall biosynthesis